MDIKTLFFSWDGRCARKPYWAGIVTVEIGIFLLSMVLGLLGVGDAGGIVATLIFAYPRICVIAKRLHVVNRSGWWQVAPNVLGNMRGRGAEGLGRQPDTEVASLLLYLGAFVVEIGFLLWLGCIRGQERNNDFGPPPGKIDVVEVF
jgi:uncharacterized membrane protein YhaH (DUF805 family)